MQRTLACLAAAAVLASGGAVSSEGRGTVAPVPATSIHSCGTKRNRRVVRPRPRRSYRTTRHRSQTSPRTVTRQRGGSFAQTNPVVRAVPPIVYRAPAPAPVVVAKPTPQVVAQPAGTIVSSRVAAASVVVMDTDRVITLAMMEFPAAIPPLPGQPAVSGSASDALGALDAALDPCADGKCAVPDDRADGQCGVPGECVGGQCGVPGLEPAKPTPPSPAPAAVDKR